MYRNVKAEMTRQGMTLEVLAPKLGITTATLSHKLNEKYPLTFGEAIRIKKELGVNIPLEELFQSYEAV